MIKNQKGQSLIEAIIALGAAVIIVSAITIVVITSVNNSDFSKNQNLATGYARQGIEIMRQKSESDWQNFSSLTGVYCLSQGSTNLSLAFGTQCATANIKDDKNNLFFIRGVSIAQNDSSCKSTLVSVSVSWSDGKCTSGSFCHNVLLNTCLANLNSAPTP